MRYLLVEGITDVSLVRYICQSEFSINFSDFKQLKPKNPEKNKINTYEYENFSIIDLKGKDNLPYVLKIIISPALEEVEKIGIIQDADDNFDDSKEFIQTAIKNSKIPSEKIQYFLTPNNKDKGDLETLLLSTIANDNEIMGCFNDYKTCLEDKNTIHPKALNKGQVHAYTMYSQKGRNLHKPQDSFIHNNIDTKLWDLGHENFKPIIVFVLSTFKD
ncbi:hypothetical protein MNB_SUP05-SYMBIONT-7-532 [hydrothermal vent metagenome]|uniref:DUF4276 family protein n=1 Tax=hydrothermal vent metagenome TaxID=652676 RepID=A0A1W1E2N3_9ZZZZ